MTPYGTTQEPLTTDHDALAVPGFGRYTISRDGQVYDTQRERLVAHTTSKVNATKQYVRLQLHNDENQRKTVYLHRLLALAFLPNPLGLPQVDHRDQNSLNNRLDNLRWATAAQNNENRRVSSRATSKFMGVSLETARGMWRATIQLDGKVKNLGVYAEERDAALAYDRAALAAGRLHHNGLLISRNQVIEPKQY